MANPGHGKVNVEADDVLADDRQAELRDLVDRLADWNPGGVAVERPHDWNGALNDRYDEYRSGERSYDREETFPGVGPDDRPITDSRSEVVQVGFRLADRLGHDRVAAIDEYPEEPDDDPFADREIDSTRKTPVDLPEFDRMEREAEKRLASSTIPEYLARTNRPDELRKNHDGMFDAGLRVADDRPWTPVGLAFWYDRNVRMIHHLWRTMAADDDRILLVVGSGHVRVLGHLLTEAPMFCPVSPLPYLPDVP